MQGKKWQRIRYMPATPLYSTGRVTACEAHVALAREIAQEGMVLLKNEGDFLPFARGQRLAVFGKAQADYVKCGGGCAYVYSQGDRTLCDGLRAAQEAGKLQVFSPLMAYYEAYVSRAYNEGMTPGSVPEPQIPLSLMQDAQDFADTALFVLCRQSTEGEDRRPVRGDYYLSEAEEALLQQIKQRFSRICVVLNWCAVSDGAWFHDDAGIQGALLAWQGGMCGGDAVADILCGAVNPSGRLADTMACSYDAYPSAEGYLDSPDYVNYQEDIFVGYRYFSTIPGAQQRVCYPFGYGLSYTQFDCSDVQGELGNDAVRLRVTVVNTGKRAGKQVVQVYASAPQGKLGKAARVLVGFAKTKSLMPGERETVTVHVPLMALASYDDTGAVCRSCDVLERGEYGFYVGENVRDALRISFQFNMDEDRVLRQCSERCAPRALPRRLRADGTYEQLTVASALPEPCLWTEASQFPRECPWPMEHGLWEKPMRPQLIDVAEGRLSLKEFLDTLTVEEQVHLLGGQPNRGVANTFGFGNLPAAGVPNVMTADGSAGLRIDEACGVSTTCFPSMTTVACTWNVELAKRMGKAGAEEVLENGIGVWLVPAVNLHRNPLNGRNFEYFSEDPVLTGAMSAALVKGIQSMGVAASLKHFACNNREWNRKDSDSRVSERALRELYLKAFEICIREAQPWTVMSAYNRINGTRASENADLLTGILREEWGFEGMVTSDWYTHGTQAAEIKAGNDVKMGCGTPEDTLRRIDVGELDPQAVRKSAERVLRMILRLS